MHTDGPRPRSGEDAPARRSGSASGTSWAVGLLCLAGLVYGTVQATQPAPSRQGLYALVLTLGTAAGWIGWLVRRHRRHFAVAVCAVALLCVSGGAMTALSPFGAVVVGVGALCAATLLDLQRAALLAALGMASATLAVFLDGQSAHTLHATGAGALLGLLLGVIRHQRTQRLRADAELALARERSAVEHERAELLAEPNRIAREVHDVLAHTLSALSVQMTAVDAVVHARLVALARQQPTAASRELPDGLTARETEVLPRMAEGLSNREIARALFVSEATVKTHVNRVFAKTGSRDRSQAIAYAHRHGLR